MDLSSASAASGDKTNILIPLILSMLGAGDMGKGLNFNLPNANGSGPNATMASITPPNALQRVQAPTSFPGSSYEGGLHGAGDVQYVPPVEQSMSPHFNQGRLMVGGQYVDTSGNPVTNFKQGGSFQQMADNNKLMTPSDLQGSLQSALRQWSQSDAPSTVATSMRQAATTPAPAAQPLPTYQPQILPNPYQGMTPPNTNAMSNLENLGAMGSISNGWNLGGFGGSGPNIGSTIPSSAYSGASAMGTGSPFAGGSFNGSPITQSIGSGSDAMSGAGGLTSGMGGMMGTQQIGAVASAIQGIGKGIGQMFTPGVLGMVQPVQMPQGINFSYPRMT